MKDNLDRVSQPARRAVEQSKPGTNAKLLVRPLFGLMVYNL